MALPERVHGVWLNRRYVGAIRQRGDHTAFQLHPSYRDAPDRPVLGLVFEQDLDKVHSAALRLPPWFSNLLPEGMLRSWIADQRGVSDRREMELLAEVGHDLPGAVTVLPMPVEAAGTFDVEAAAPQEPAPRPLPDDVDPRGRFSLAGVQLKLSMVAAGERLVVPLGGQAGDWIVKFPDSSLPHLPVVEFVTMTLAARAGLDVPSIRLVPRDLLPDTPAGLWGGTESWAFAIERFDRGPDRTAIHIEDFAQVRDFWPEQKYAGSYATLARLVHRGQDVDALVEFARRLAFNLLVDNADAHLKNWSLIYRDPRRPTLSPAYDLVSAAGFDGFGGETALAFGRSRRADTVTYAAFDRLAEVTGCPDVGLAEVARDVVRRARDAWPAVAQEWLGQHPAIRDAISTVIDARARTLDRL